MKVFGTSAKSHVVSTTARAAFFGLLILAAPLAASAATRCVTTAAKSACPAGLTYATITDAINASSAGDTIQVAKGTYAEDVKIGKSLFIVGASQKNTIVDATGLSNGFYVDGIDDPGVSDVVISGFTVKNANFEGILVANASSVTISNNIVTGNDKGLTMPDTATVACNGLPSFETAEPDDCGEGIHLLGADHSIVSNNLVENNAGGILISDDTAPATLNFITGNTVQKNPFDCGITLGVASARIDRRVGQSTGSHAEYHFRKSIHPERPQQPRERRGSRHLRRRGQWHQLR